MSRIMRPRDLLEEKLPTAAAQAKERRAAAQKEEQQLRRAFAPLRRNIDQLAASAVSIECDPLEPKGADTKLLPRPGADDQLGECLPWRYEARVGRRRNGGGWLRAKATPDGRLNVGLRPLRPTWADRSSEFEDANAAFGFFCDLLAPHVVQQGRP